MGEALISIEILPIKLAKEFDNGLGRDSPNQYPSLPEPKGRFSFVRFNTSLNDLGLIFTYIDA